jgi:hypothetical protein
MSSSDLEPLWAFHWGLNIPVLSSDDIAFVC